MDSLHKRPVIQSYDVFFAVSLNRLLNKQSLCRWFEMQRRSCDVTVMLKVCVCGSYYHPIAQSLQWRHNGHDSVSNHHPHDCLLNRLFRLRSKKSSKLRVTGLCAGNSPGTGEFPAQMASYAANVSIWWRHHEQKSLENNLSCTETSQLNELWQIIPQGWHMGPVACNNQPRHSCTLLDFLWLNRLSLLRDRLNRPLMRYIGNGFTVRFELLQYFAKHRRLF